MRLLALLGTFAVLGGLLCIRLAYWQIGQGPDLQRVAAAQQQVVTAQDDVRRGDITDRNGTVLATTAYRDSLGAYPDMMSSDEQKAVAAQLAQILGMTSQQLATLLASFTDSEGKSVPYVVISHELTDQQDQAVRAALAAGTLSELDLEPHAVRVYPTQGGAPGTTLASQLLGFVTSDGQGRYGIEQADQSTLAGTGNTTADASGNAPLPQEGGDVQLTIDSSLQLRLEKELYAGWVADDAPRVSGVVMDANTGAILAWGSVPGYDENDYADVAQSDPDLFNDPIATEVYEPGSVMKMFTAAAALNEGILTLTTPEQDQRELVFGNDIVQDFDKKSMGTLSFEDAIANSRNVVAGKVAMELGKTNADSSNVLYNMWQTLGIGEKTGVEVGNESAGLVTNPATTPWQPIDLVNHSFGQGVAVTPLQLVRAFAAMANGGFLVQPHVYTADDASAQASIQQVISPTLSDTLQQLMIHVVDAGPDYAVQTKIPGYVVGGKTGTAQIWDPQSGGWLPDTYNHTFVGFVGNPKPQLIILVRIHDTIPSVKVSWGYTLEMTSNELWRRVALDAISALDLPAMAGYDNTSIDPTEPPYPVIDGAPPSVAPSTPSPRGQTAAAMGPSGGR